MPKTQGLSYMEAIFDPLIHQNWVGESREELHGKFGKKEPGLVF